MTDVKICGITDDAGLTAAAEAGASFIGLVFYPSSPRAVTPKTACGLAGRTPPGIKKVGLFVNPALDEVARVLETVPLDMIQLHGEESPFFLKDLKKKTGLPVIKAIPVAAAEDLTAAHYHEEYADWLLFDARAPETGLPGGRGERFDWELLSGFPHRLPWMLAGGLNTGNVKEAIRLLNPPAVDVSSGVESAPGRKDPDKIREFIEAARKSG